MSSFYIVPPRKIASSLTGQDFVTSLRVGAGILTNDIYFQSANESLTITLNDDYIDFSINSNLFIKKTGDTVTGNIRFTPTVGNVGLVVGYATSDPASTEVGGIYYNTASSTLRIYGSNSQWTNVAQVGALTLAEANSNYLQLNGGTLTGRLVLSGAKLKLGVFSGSDPSGEAGEIIYRSDQTAIKLNIGGTSWVPLSLGALSVRGGAGIKANGSTGGAYLTTGNVEFSIDYTAANTWTGTQNFNSAVNFGSSSVVAFNAPITFSTSQTFNISSLTNTSQTNGSIIYYNGSTSLWTVLSPGTANQVLKIDSSTSRPVWGDLPIGSPSDTVYTDGFFDEWTSGTQVADALDDVNEILNIIGPEKPGYLTSAVLSTSTEPQMFTAKLSTGLNTSWYDIYNSSGSSTTLVAGDTITNYTLSSTVSQTSWTLQLNTPNTSTSFFVGKNSSTSFGTLSHVTYDYSGTTVLTSYSLSTTGNTGTLTVSSLVSYNSYWKKANAYLVYNTGFDGWLGHTISHSLGGQTAIKGYFRDSVSSETTNPSFSVSPAIVEDSTIYDKWLSGIKYYTHNGTNGSQFRLTFKAATGIFNRCYHASNVVKVYGSGFSETIVNPATPPAYNAEFDKTGGNYVPLTLSNNNQSQDTLTATVALFKAHGTTIGSNGTATSSVTLPRGVNTYNTDPATNTVEYFQGETRRLINGSTASFNSQTGMTNGYSQVKNGKLIYPLSSDYTNASIADTTCLNTVFAGSQRYDRFFVNEFSSGITLTINGLTSVSDISAYPAGDLNIIAQLYDLENPSTPLYYDLGTNYINNVPLVQTFSEGVSNYDLYGSKVSSTLQGTNSIEIKFTFGPQNTQSTGVSPNLGKYRLIIIHNNNNKTITQITSVSGT